MSPLFFNFLNTAVSEMETFPFNHRGAKICRHLSPLDDWTVTVFSRERCHVWSVRLERSCYSEDNKSSGKKAKMFENGGRQL